MQANPYLLLPVGADIALVVGNTLPFAAELQNEDGSGYDFTGCTGVLVVTRNGSTVNSGALTLTSGGQMSRTVAAATTATWQPCEHRYYVDVTFADGTVRTIFHGKLTVYPK